MKWTLQFVKNWYYLLPAASFSRSDHHLWPCSSRVSQNNSKSFSFFVRRTFINLSTCSALWLSSFIEAFSSSVRNPPSSQCRSCNKFFAPMLRLKAKYCLRKADSLGKSITAKDDDIMSLEQQTNASCTKPRTAVMARDASAYIMAFSVVAYHAFSYLWA